MSTQYSRAVLTASKDFVLETGRATVSSFHAHSYIDRVLSGLVALYFAYRLWTGTKSGIMAGDGDKDVSAEAHPVVFSLTALTTAMVAALFAYVAIGPSAAALLSQIIPR